VLVCVPDADATALLSRLKDMTKDNGVLFSLEFTAIREPFTSAGGTVFRNRRELIGLFEKAGFRLENEAYAFPPLVLPSVLHRLLMPGMVRETRFGRSLLKFGLWIQDVFIDPVLEKFPKVYVPLLYFKRTYPVHHRAYVYRKV